MHAQALNTHWQENLNNKNRFEHFLGNNRIGMVSSTSTVELNTLANCYSMKSRVNLYKRY